MALLGFDTPSPDVEPSRKPLNAAQLQSLAELEFQLTVTPEPIIKEHSQDDRRSRLLRWLRSEDFNVPLAYQRLVDHAKWWTEYGVDNFRPEDENDETGPLFACGEDRWGRPTIIARPAAHNAKNREESILAARRCVFTLLRLVARMPQGLERFIVIYDTRNLTRNNLDIVFSKELIPILANHFPGRLHRVIVTNNHWGLFFFWAAISVLLPPCAKEKITFAGVDFHNVLGEVVGEEHPYLRYMIDVQRSSDGEIPLPASSAYFAHSRQGFELTKGGSSYAEDTESTAASSSDVASSEVDEDVFFDCREEEEEEDVEALSSWASVFACACVRKP